MGIELLMRFAGKALDAHGGDWDGADLEETLEACGLLVPVKVEAPCGDECECSPGDTCFRVTELGKACVQAGRNAEP
jgi:hypothetical protein